ALTSPIVQLNVRDKWVGWSPDAFVAQVRSNPSTEMAKWLQAIVDDSIEEIYKRDFIESGEITMSGVKRPTPDLIETLEKVAKLEREKHHHFTKASDYKSGVVEADGKVDWAVQARNPLYRSKRAESLARFLRYRVILDHHFGSKPSS